MKSNAFYFISLLTLFNLSACSEKTDVDYAKLGQQQLADNNQKSAILSFKNAIKLAPNNPAYRAKLAKIYADRGGILEGQKEYEKAIELGDSNRNTAIELARLYYISESYTQISELFSFSNPLELNIGEFTYYALSIMNIEGGEAANKLISQYKKANPEYSNRINALDYLAKKDFTNALNELNVEYENIPNDLFINLLRGQLALHLQKTEMAVESLGFFAKHQPLYPTAKVFYLAALLKAEKYIEAKATISDLFKVNKQHPYTNFVAAIIAFNEKDYTAAKAYIDTAITNGYQSEYANFIAGISDFKLNNIESAHQHFVKIKDVLYKYPYAENAYISTKISLGYSDDAADYFIETSEKSNLETGIITNVASSLIASGDTEKTKALLTAIENKPDSPKQKTLQGYLKLLLNDETGLDDLKATINSMDNGLETRKLVIASLIHEKKYDDAIIKAKEWLNYDENNKLTPLHILTTVYALKNELDTAEDYAKQALSVSENDPASLLFFAKKEKEAKNILAAINLTNNILAQDKLFLPAVSLLRQLYVEQEDLNAYLEKMDQLIHKHPANIGLNNLYIKELMFNKEHNKVISFLTNNTLRKDNLYYQALGDSYLLTGQLVKAEETYLAWSKKSDDDFPFYRLLKAWEVNKNFAQIITALKEKSKNAPNNYQYQLLLADAYLDSSQTQEAKALLPSLKSKTNNSDVYRAIEGKFHFINKDYKKAVPGLTLYYQKAATTKNALLLYNTLINAGEKEEAFAHLEKHIESATNPTLFKTILAEAYIKDKPKKAIAYYEEIIASGVNDAVIYNNISWLYSSKNDFSTALYYSAKALELAPKHPSVLDSHGKNLAEMGKLDEAVKYLSDAYEITQTNPEINLNLVEVLIKTNKKKLAAEILNKTKNFSSESQKLKAKKLTQLLQD